MGAAQDQGIHIFPLYRLQIAADHCFYNDIVLVGNAVFHQGNEQGAGIADDNSVLPYGADSLAVCA